MEKKLQRILIFFFRILKKYSNNKYHKKIILSSFHKIFNIDLKYLYKETIKEKFLLHSNENISKSIFIDDFFEFDKIEKSLKLLKTKYSYLIDIGANIGSISIPSLTRNFFSTVIAFEPEKESYRLLKINCLLNDLNKKMILHKIALSNKKKTLSLIANNASNRGDNRIKTKLTKKKTLNIQKIKSDILDNYTINLNKKNAFIKIDVQGHESKVFLGAKKTLKKQIPIMFELEPTLFPKSWKSDFKHVFKNYKYFYDLKSKSNKKIKFSLTSMEEIFNYYLINKSYTDILII